MFNRIDPGLNGVVRRLIAMTMDRHLLAQAVGFIDQRGDLRRRELRGIHIIGQGKNPSGNGRLDHVRPVLDLKPDRFSNRVRSVRNPVGKIRLRPEDQIAEPGGRIEMAAGGADSFGCDQHARTDDVALVDSVAQGHIDELTAAEKAAAQIPHRGETGLDGRACESRSLERLLGHI